MKLFLDWWGLWLTLYCTASYILIGLFIRFMRFDDRDDFTLKMFVYSPLSLPIVIVVTPPILLFCLIMAFYDYCVTMWRSS